MTPKEKVIEKWKRKPKKQKCEFCRNETKYIIAFRMGEQTDKLTRYDKTPTKACPHCLINLLTLGLNRKEIMKIEKIAEELNYA